MKACQWKLFKPGKSIFEQQVQLGLLCIRQVTLLLFKVRTIST